MVSIEETRIYHQQKTLFAQCLFLAVVAFVCLPCSLLDDYHKGKMPFAKVEVSILGAVLFAIPILYLCLYKAILRKPAIVVGERGLYDSVALMGAFGWVPWSEVEEVSLTFYCGKQVVALRLKARSGYSPQFRPLQRFCIQVNRLLHCGPPVVLFGTFLEIPIEEVYAHIQIYFTRYQQSPDFIDR